MPSTADRVVLITGASSGIGEAIARGVAGSGRRVVLAARSSTPLTALADELGGPERALAVPCDVTDWDAVQAAVATGLSSFGRLDAVCANAGIGAARGFGNESPERWRELILTNIYGVALTIRAATPALVETGGHLLLTSAVTGRHPLPGSVYSGTKAAVAALGEAARKELGRDGVRVTTLAPGTVDTAFWDNPQADALRATDLADAVLFALDRPPHMSVNEIVLRAVAQYDP
ncbi:putative oxidoreductase [Paraconexibacter sp. AEG42_29]|uniref:Oxidoreductase n=1 Tax=Paraconexibacter sp. AEG42_29 TaxID=2997339 RepID=A0AAU7APG2_9ACTN